MQNRWYDSIHVLGEYNTDTDFTCGKGTGGYDVCAPTSSVVKASVAALQKAADDVVMDMPLWNVTIEGHVYDKRPIQSGHGYDGTVGVETAGIVQNACVAANQIQREAGEPDPTINGVVIAERVANYADRIRFIAEYADEIAAYLAGIHARAASLLETARANDAAKTAALIAAGWDAAKAAVASVFVTPPVIPNAPGAPTGHLVTKRKGFPTAFAVAGTVTGAALIGGLLAYNSSNKPGEQEQVNFPPVAGAGWGRRRGHGRRR